MEEMKGSLGQAMDASPFLPCALSIWSSGRVKLVVVLWQDSCAVPALRV